MESPDKIILEDIKKVAAQIDLKQLRNSRILLTGASGLLGSYLAYLISYLNKELDFEIKADLISKNPITNKSILWNMKDARGIRFQAKDLSQSFCYDAPYDFMIHAAGYGTPGIFIKDPIGTINVNYIGIKNILEGAQKLNPEAKIMYFSSSEIYGSPPPEQIPTVEDYPGNSSVANNRACYIESKRLSEVLCLTYAEQFGMNIKIVRPALSYGPGLSLMNGRVISEFIKRAYLTKIIDMKDDGRDMRAYCYISDALRQLISILLFGKQTIYNVGSDKEEISVKELAQKIGKIMGAEVKTGPGKDPLLTGAPSRVCLNIDRIKNEFGFEPEVLIGEGLRKMIEWNLTLIKNGTLTL